MGVGLEISIFWLKCVVSDSMRLCVCIKNKQGLAGVLTNAYTHMPFGLNLLVLSRDEEYLLGYNARDF